MAYENTISAIAIYPDKPGSLHRTTIATGEPADQEVEIAVIRVGVCGTDREIIRGKIGFPPAGSAELVIGHEMVGRVTRVGPNVDRVKAGELVTVSVRRPDGCPACLAGEPDMCLWLEYTERGISGAHGFMAQRVTERQEWVVKVPEHLEPVAVLTEPLTVVEKALRQAGLIQRRLNHWNLKTAIVMGAGPIGLLGTLLLRSKGVDVFTVARTAGPNAAAAIVEACGATYVSTREESITELAARIGGVDLIIESTGSSQVVFESMRNLGNNGVLVLLGLTGGDHTLEIPADDLNTSLVVGNKVVVGSVNAGIEDFVNAVADLDQFDDLWPGLALSMITHRLTMADDLDQIATRIDGGIKTVIEFGSGEA